MLSAAAFAPSSPLLSKSVNKHQRDDFITTERSWEHLADDWYVRHIETVLIITPSRFAYNDAVTLDVADPYHMDLEELGDVSPKAIYHPDLALIDQLQRVARASQNASAQLTLSTEPSLPFGCAAALNFLERRLRAFRIVPISPAQNLDIKAHYQLGTCIRQALDTSTKRIGILALSDVSLNQLSDITTILQEKSIASLMHLNASAPELREQPLSKVLGMFFGILDGTATRGEIMSVESPFNVGYIIARFP